MTPVGHASDPVAFQLYQNFPNPFNPETTIRYKVPTMGHVSVKIFDIIGKEVQALVDQIQDAGSYEAVFDARRFPSGFYFCVLSSPFGRAIKKMVLVK